MKSFEIFLSLLATIPDPRRAEGKLYRLPHVLLFSILAVSSGADSYRGIRTFIRVHRQRLNEAFGIDWKRAPAHTSIRFILQGLKASDVETAFRNHASALDDGAMIASVRTMALDGKVLKGSFDAFNDAKARQVLSAFATDTALVLAHFEIDEKSNEIPAAQKLFAELDLTGRVVTLDAMHCQKKPSRRRRPRTPI
jgi:DDE_Tnp_1-associated